MNAIETVSLKMPRSFATSFLAILLTVVPARPAGESSVQVAIIVNKGNRIDKLSAKDLKQIYTGAKAKWPDGVQIQTLATGANTPEHRVAIKFLFGMNEPEYEKYRLHATFVGNTQEIPRDYGSSEAVLRFVSLIPGAIGFIRADAVNSSVKVIPIEGWGPDNR